MALSITQQPNEYAPAYNDTNFVITESSGGIYTKDNFKFIAEVKQSTTSLAKLKAPIYYGSTNKGVFNIGRILENYVTMIGTSTIVQQVVAQIQLWITRWSLDMNTLHLLQEA